MPRAQTDYEGLAYLGETLLNWAACCNNEACYNMLVDRDADPNAKDSFGNMVLHMIVVCDKQARLAAAGDGGNIPTRTVNSNHFSLDARSTSTSLPG